MIRKIFLYSGLLIVISHQVIIRDDYPQSKLPSIAKAITPEVEKTLSHKTYSYIDVKRFFNPANEIVFAADRLPIQKKKMKIYKFVPGFIESDIPGYLVPNYDTPNIQEYVSPALRLASSYARNGAQPVPLSSYKLKYHYPAHTVSENSIMYSEHTYYSD